MKGGQTPKRRLLGWIWRCVVADVGPWCCSRDALWPVLIERLRAMEAKVEACLRVSEKESEKERERRIG